jgi:membrane protein
LGQRLTAIHDFFRHRLWEDGGRSRVSLIAAKCLRVLILAGRGLIKNNSLVRSSSLAYATILGFIPLFALLFAILQAIGIPRLLATYFLENLAPGSKSFVNQILYYIENTKVTSLGVFGVVALLCDLVVIMTNVEKGFNQIWQVSRTRTWSRKISDYLSIFLIFPILMAVTISISSSFLHIHEVQQILEGVMPAVFFTATRWLVSLGVLWLAFIFIYLVMPNTRVNFWSAVLGGVVGGSIWQSAQWIFIAIQGESAYYNAIYGALYNLLFIFIWMFWCWLILLFGTEVAYAHQNLKRLTRAFRRPGELPEPVDEYLGLAAMLSICARFFRRQPPLSLGELDDLLPSGNNLAGRAVQMLQDCNLVVEVTPRSPAPTPQFIPNLPLQLVTVQEVLDCLRRSREARLVQNLAEEEPGIAGTMIRLLESRTIAAGPALSLQEAVQSLNPEKEPEGEADSGGAPG